MAGGSAKANMRILTLGDSAVGKTSLLRRYSNNEFAMSQVSTIGIDFVSKKTEISGTPVTLQIWDTAGQERFRSLARGYFKSADGVIMVYDVTRRVTFEAIGRWMEDLRSKADPRVVVLLVGNKADKEEARMVETKEGAELAKSVGARAGFIETSCLRGDGVEEAFTRIAKLIFEEKYGATPTPYSASKEAKDTADVVSVRGEEGREGKGCC